MTRSRLAVVLVHYHTPELVPEAVAALRADLARCDLAAELVLVDNGSRPGERAEFEELGLRVLDPGANTGYSGGVNRGAAATTAPLLVFMNPDVLVRPGCLGRLVAQLEAGAAVAGPRFFWDRGERLLLPPAEPRSRRWELRAALARTHPARALRARQLWRRHARRHWQATEPLPSHDLSGALLALRRDAWQRVGPFDEAYRLYFEETDWLLRLRRQGLAARHVPAARAVHLYNRSAAREGQAAAWFAESRRRFVERHYGRWFGRLLGRLEGRVPKPPEGESVDAPLAAPERPTLDLRSYSREARPLWVELSPLEVGFPAAAQFLAEPRSWELPDEVWQGCEAGRYGVRVVTEDGQELGCRFFER